MSAYVCREEKVKGLYQTAPTLSIPSTRILSYFLQRLSIPEFHQVFHLIVILYMYDKTYTYVNIYL
jgi:hypothetical protein